MKLLYQLIIFLIILKIVRRWSSWDFMHFQDYRWNSRAIFAFFSYIDICTFTSGAWSKVWFGCKMTKICSVKMRSTRKQPYIWKQFGLPALHLWIHYAEAHRDWNCVFFWVTIYNDLYTTEITNWFGLH